MIIPNDLENAARQIPRNMKVVPMQATLLNENFFRSGPFINPKLHIIVALR